MELSIRWIAGAVTYLDGKPGITADLEAVRQAGKLLHFIVGERYTVKLVVVLDAGLGDRLIKRSQQAVRVIYLVAMNLLLPWE